MVRIPVLALILLALATAATARGGQALAVLEDTSAFDTPSESAQPRPEKARKGDLYVLLSTQGEWYQVQFDERPAWLKKGKQPGAQQSGAQAGSTQQKNNLEVKSGVALKRVTASALNVRAGAGMTGAILGTLPGGTMVVERGGTGEWRQLSFRGRTAYVYGDYLESERATRPATSAPQANPTGTSQSGAGSTTGASGGSSGLGTPSSKQGSAVQKSPFQDLLSKLTGGGGGGGGSESASTSSATPEPTSTPSEPVTPGTPEVPTSVEPSRPSGSSSAPSSGSSSGGSSDGGSSDGGSSDSMWDDAADPLASSTELSSTTRVTRTTSTASESGSSSAPGTSETPTSTEGEATAPAASGASDGVGFGAAAPGEDRAARDGEKDGGGREDEKDAAAPAEEASDDAATDEATGELPALEGDAASEPLTLSEEDLELIARIVQGEAIQCSHEARVAVAAVVLNRLRSPSFPDVVKRVVRQRLQFPSYALDVRDALLAQPLDEGCLEAAREAAGGFDPTDGATHFYNPHLVEKPTWVHRMDRTVRFGERPDDTLEFYRPRPTPPSTTASMFDE